MPKTIKLVSLSAAVVLGVGLLGGCVDKEARNMAQEALSKASGAQMCCNDNTERLDRMFKKIMGK